MINKKQIAEMAKHILKHSQGLRDHKIMHPERDWFIGLGLAITFFVGSASVSAYTYWKNKNMSASQDAAVAEEVVVYRESMVKDALARFEKRNKEREALVAEFSSEEPTPVSDTATSTPAENGSTTPETATGTSSTAL